MNVETEYVDVRKVTQTLAENRCSVIELLTISICYPQLHGIFVDEIFNKSGL